MLKTVSRLEHKIGEKAYQFICDHDSPISEVKESLFQFLKYVGQIEDNAKASQAQQQSVESFGKDKHLEEDSQV